MIANTSNYRFDLYGRLIVNNTPITALYEIDLNGDNNLQVAIELEGFVHE